jgi:hypothetical protein
LDLLWSSYGSDLDLVIYLNVAPDPDFSVAPEVKKYSLPPLLVLLSFFSKFENIDIGARNILKSKVLNQGYFYQTNADPDRVPGLYAVLRIH